MRKYVYALLAILLIAVVAYPVFATSYPQSEESANNGPWVWTVPVFNDSGSALAVGDVVVWYINDSSGDDDNYVTTSTTKDTYLVAGVVYANSIADAAVGEIAIRGVVPVNWSSGVGEAGSIVCNAPQAKYAGNCANNKAAIGVVTQAPSSGVAKVMLTLQ